MKSIKPMKMIEGFERNSHYCLKAEVSRNGRDVTSLEVVSDVFGEIATITQKGDSGEVDSIYLWDRDYAKRIVTILESWINKGDSMYAEQDAEFKVDNLTVTVNADIKDLPKVTIEHTDGGDYPVSLETWVEVEKLEEALGEISNNFELNEVVVNEEISITCVPETNSVTIRQTTHDNFEFEVDTYRPNGVDNLRGVLKVILAQ